MSEDLTGTKAPIFDIALEMFAFKGYERVTMGGYSQTSWQVASIYCHYIGTDEILECMYQYFADHYRPFFR